MTRLEKLKARAEREAQAEKRIAELEAENARLRAAMEQVEYIANAAEGMEGFSNCPWCGQFSDEPHAGDCARQLALAPIRKRG